MEYSIKLYLFNDKHIYRHKLPNLEALQVVLGLIIKNNFEHIKRIEIVMQRISKENNK